VVSAAGAARFDETAAWEMGVMDRYEDL